MQTGALAGDEIILTVPAEAGFARVARVCGGALAARLGFGYDEIEEIRVTVGEAWTQLVTDDVPGDQVELRFQVLPDGLALDAALTGSGHRSRSIHLEKRLAS